MAESEARQKFEQWARNRGEDVRKRADGRYLCVSVDFAWEAYQAGAESSKWIPVEERLPELEDHMGAMESAVLLFRHGRGTPHLGWMTKDAEWMDYWKNERYSCTHWREFDESLPAPPVRDQKL